MGFRLKNDYVIRYEVPLLEFNMSCYNTLRDDSFDLDRDGLLEQRSAYEMVRDQLTAAQRAELDMIDTHWRADPAGFNRAFAVMHHQQDKETALAGRVTDADGNTPAIPRSHWWWWPIEEDM